MEVLSTSKRCSDGEAQESGRTLGASTGVIVLVPCVIKAVRVDRGIGLRQLGRRLKRG